MMSKDERVYTNMSGLAVRGLQRLARDRDIFVRESPKDRGGYTVITTGRSSKKGGWAPKRQAEKLSA
jgi:hypothetical protein